MLRRILLNSFILLFFFAYITKAVSAQNDPITHVWLNTEKTAKIEIYQEGDGKYYGKVVWLKKPNINGKPKIDIYNPDKTKRNRPFMGMVVLKGFVKTATGVYENGTVYDPTTGKTYRCKMFVSGEKLHLRGYWGISLIGKSAVWTKAE